MSRTMSGAARRRAGVAFAVATASLAGAARADESREPCCVAAFAIEAVALPASADGTRAVPLGGISDLCFGPAGTAAGRLWAITDRGPNGEVDTPAGMRRSLLAPGFVPCLVELVTAPLREACAAPLGQAERRRLAGLGVASVLPLRTASGRPASGRPRGTRHEKPIVDHETLEPVPADPDGIDSEAVVALPDGSLWIAEEYGPSLLHVAADGRMLARLVPAGSDAPAADTVVSPVLPAAYALRRDNRGFESLAVLDGGRLIAALLQSPLETDDAEAGRRAGNVPLLVVDTVTRRPVAEHVYRAGDPAHPRSSTSGRPPDDVKLCAMTATGAGTLVVIEQGDDGSALLYAADLAGATNMLPRRLAAGEPEGDAPVIEAIADLAGAGVVPVAKRLVADLGPLLPRMRADARLEADDPLKLEGLALLDDRHVALVNDDDFGVHAAGDADGPRPCLWIVRLAEPVTRHAAASIHR